MAYQKTLSTRRYEVHYVCRAAASNCLTLQDLATFDVVLSTVDTVRQELRDIADKKATQDFFRTILRGRGLPDCLHEEWYQRLKLKGILHKTKWLRVIIE